MGNNTVTLKARLQNKYSSRSNWDSFTEGQFIPLKGEVCYAYDEKNKIMSYKIGDGTTDFVNLPWVNDLNYEIEESILSSSSFVLPQTNDFEITFPSGEDGSGSYHVYGYSRLNFIPELDLDMLYTVNITQLGYDEGTQFTETNTYTATWQEIPELPGIKALLTTDNSNLPILIQGLTSTGIRMSNPIGKLDENNNPIYDDQGNIVPDENSWLALVGGITINGPYNTIEIQNVESNIKNTNLISDSQITKAIQSNWEEKNENNLSFIKNKPFGEKKKNYDLTIFSNEFSANNESFLGELESITTNGISFSVIRYNADFYDFTKFNSPGVVTKEAKFSLKLQSKNAIEVTPALYETTYQNLKIQIMLFGNLHLAKYLLHTHINGFHFDSMGDLSENDDYCLLIETHNGMLQNCILLLKSDAYNITPVEEKYPVYCDLKYLSDNIITKIDNKYIDQKSIQPNLFEYDRNSPQYVKNEYGTGLSLVTESVPENYTVTATLHRTKITPTKNRFTCDIPGELLEALQMASLPGSKLKFTIGDNEPLVLHSYWTKGSSGEEVLNFGNFNLVNDWLTDFFGIGYLDGDVGNNEPICIEVSLTDNRMTIYPDKKFDLDTDNLSASVSCTIQILSAPYLTHALHTTSLAGLPEPIGELNEDTHGVMLEGATSADGLYSLSGGYDSSSNGDYSVALGRSNEASGKNSFAVGENNTVTHDYAAAIGRENTTTRHGQILLGEYANPSENSILTIGAFDETQGMGGASYNVLDLSDKGNLNIMGDIIIDEGNYNKTYSGTTENIYVVKRSELKDPDQAETKISAFDTIDSYTWFKGRNMWSWGDKSVFDGYNVTVNDNTGMVSFTKPADTAVEITYSPLTLSKALPLTLSIYGDKTQGANSYITLNWDGESIGLGESITKTTTNTEFTFSIPADCSGEINYGIQLEYGSTTNPYLPPAERETIEVNAKIFTLDLTTAGVEDFIILNTTKSPGMVPKTIWTQILNSNTTNSEWDDIENKPFGSEISTIANLIDYGTPPVYQTDDGLMLFKTKDFVHLDVNHIFGFGPSVKYLITIDDVEYGPYMFDEGTIITADDFTFKIYSLSDSEATELDLEEGFYYFLQSDTLNFTDTTKVGVKTIGNATTLIPCESVSAGKTAIFSDAVGWLGKPTPNQLSRINIYFDGIFYKNINWKEITIYDQKYYYSGNLSIITDLEVAYGYENTGEPYLCVINVKDIDSGIIICPKDRSIEHTIAVEFIPVNEIITRIPEEYLPESPYEVLEDGEINFPQGDIFLDGNSLVQHLTNLVEVLTEQINTSQINSDYEVNDTTSKAYILNRPFYEKIKDTEELNIEIYNDTATSGISFTREIVDNVSTLTQQGQVYHGILPFPDANAIEYFNRNYTVKIIQAKTSSNKDNGQTVNATTALATVVGQWQQNGNDVYIGNLYLASFDEAEDTKEGYLYYFNNALSVLECYYSPSYGNLHNYDGAMAKGVITTITVTGKQNVEISLLNSKYLPTSVVTKKPNGSLYAKDLVLYSKEKDTDGIISVTTISLLAKIQELEERLAALEGV